MIPEITRRFPPSISALGYLTYSRVRTPRCVRKYTKPRPDDIVLDVGAYQGEFAIPASKYCEKVYAIEPDFRSYNYLQEATWPIDNISVLKMGVCKTDGMQTFTQSVDASDSVLGSIASDSEALREVSVPVRRLDSLTFIDEITYLKIDAEGLEPEVLESLGNVRPKKISVDVSPERNGKDTLVECANLFGDSGYLVRRHNDVLIGVHNTYEYGD